MNNKFDPLLKGIAQGTKEFVDKKVTPLDARITALESRWPNFRRSAVTKAFGIRHRYTDQALASFVRAVAGWLQEPTCSDVLARRTTGNATRKLLLSLRGPATHRHRPRALSMLRRAGHVSGPPVATGRTVKDQCTRKLILDEGNRALARGADEAGVLRYIRNARRSRSSGHHSRAVVSSYSDTRRQPNFQFWVCNWSLQRSALVQSLKTRDPSM